LKPRRQFFRDKSSLLQPRHRAGQLDGESQMVLDSLPQIRAKKGTFGYLAAALLDRPQIAHEIPTIDRRNELWFEGLQGLNIVPIEEVAAILG
jgi:hypothetical protein